MAKKRITFVATQYKSKPVTVSFYSVEGGRVKFISAKKVPARGRRRVLARVK